MAVFTNSDLKRRRELLKMTAATLAEEIGCDTNTIYSYERGKSTPDPDVVYQIAEAFGDINIWYDWMRTRYSSYARNHPEGMANDLPGATMTMFAELADLLDLQREAMRDAADGHFDDPKLREAIQTEAKEALAAIQRFMNVFRSSQRM